jgi:hypothetical protein
LEGIEVGSVGAVGCRLSAIGQSSSLKYVATEDTETKENLRRGPVFFVLSVNSVLSVATH